MINCVFALVQDVERYLAEQRQEGARIREADARRRTNQMHRLLADENFIRTPAELARTKRNTSSASSPGRNASFTG